MRPKEGSAGIRSPSHTLPLENQSKEKRKAFCRENGTRAKEISKVCRNHGGCEWCLDNRTHKYQRDDEAVAERMREYNDLGVCEEIT